MATGDLLSEDIFCLPDGPALLDCLEFEVADNGRGVPAGVTGSGLANLRQRAEDVGGSFTLEALPTGGTRLRWCAPLP